MKLNSNKSTKRGIAMTEYLIILAIVAVASIGVTSVFGGSVKTLWKDLVIAVSGGKPDPSGRENTRTEAERIGAITPTMENFDKQP